MGKITDRYTLKVLSHIHEYAEGIRKSDNLEEVKMYAAHIESMSFNAIEDELKRRRKSDTET